MWMIIWFTQPYGGNTWQSCKSCSTRSGRRVGPTRPSKCCQGHSSLEFVGYTMGSDQIAMEEDKLNALIQRSRGPATDKKKQDLVWSFLGLAGYYRGFLTNYVEVTTPLTDLMKKGQLNKVTWEEPQLIAFQKLKDILGSNPDVWLWQVIHRAGRCLKHWYSCRHFAGTPRWTVPISACQQESVKSRKGLFCDREKECPALMFKVLELSTRNPWYTSRVAR